MHKSLNAQSKPSHKLRIVSFQPSSHGRKMIPKAYYCCCEALQIFFRLYVVKCQGEAFVLLEI
jgi:hypothetical protein